MANPIVSLNNKYSGKALDLNGNIIDKSGWDVYEYIFNDTPYSGSTEDYDISIVDSSDISSIKTALTQLANAARVLLNRNSNTQYTERPYYISLSSMTDSAEELIANPDATIYAGNRIFKLLKNEITKFCKTIYVDTITFGVDIFIYDTWGKNWWKEGSELWDKMLFELKAGDSSSYDNFFTNFDNANPTESENADFYYGTYKDVSFQVKSNLEYVESVDEPEHLERVNNMLVTNRMDVSQGMTIEFQGVKSSVYVPTVVAFDVNGNIVVSASTWKDGAFTYKVPENIKKIVIQIYNNGTKTNIRTKMPPVLLAASYKNGHLMDYVIKADYNIERNASETSERDLSRETFNTYYINYILKNKFDKILVTAQHYGSANKVNVEKNTIRKSSVLGYESKEEDTFPNAVSTVESYIYTTLLNRIKSLENKISGKLLYSDLINPPDFVTKKEFNKVIKETVSGTTIITPTEIEWSDIKNAPSWITQNKPDVSYFNGVPTSRKINGMELIDDITVRTVLPVKVLDIINNINVVWDLPDTIYNENILIGKKLYFGKIHEQEIDPEETEPYDNFFEWDYEHSALTFSGNFYTKGGIASLNSFDLGSGASLTIANVLTSTATTESLSAAMGKKLNDEKVPNTRKINNSALTADITISLDTLGAVPTTRQINGSALTQDLYITCANIGAVPTSRTINGSALTSNISVTTSSIGAVPTSRTINGSALTQNLVIESITSAITDGTHTITTQGGTIGGNLRLRYSTEIFGSKLNFGDGDYCYLYEDRDDHLKIYSDKGMTLQYVDRIYFSGSTTSNYLEYDSTNGALKFEGSLYVTGGLSSLGFSSNGNSGTVAKLIVQSGLTVNSATTINSNLTVKNTLIFDHGASIYSDSNGRLHFGGGYGDEISQSIAYADNQALYVDYLITTSQNMAYENGSNTIYVPSQFDVIKYAFSNYSTLSDIKSYIVNNLK